MSVWFDEEMVTSSAARSSSLKGYSELRIRETLSYGAFMSVYIGEPDTRTIRIKNSSIWAKSVILLIS